jgi:TPR repeat protein
MKKIIGLHLIFICYISNAQKCFVSSFIDSVSAPVIYNPLKIDTILNVTSFPKAEWYSSVVQLEKDKKFEQAYAIFEPKKNTEPLAMYLLGKYFYHNLSKATPTDKGSAFLWFNKASALNFAPAQESMAKMIFDGEERIQNDSSAIALLKLAINNGSKTVFDKLGFIYQTAKSKKKNIDSALFWYQKAIAEKNFNAMHNTATIYESRMFYETMLTNYNEAAQNKVILSDRRLGEIYYKGLGVPKDENKAKMYFEQAYTLGDGGASNFLGIINSKASDFEKTFAYFMTSSQRGDSYGNYNAAICLSEGIGTEPNATKALELYKSVSDQNAEARNNIGTLYERSMIDKNNLQEARKWYEGAANGGSVLGMMNLGKITFQTDRTQAIKWLEKAANTNNLNAITHYIKSMREVSFTDAVKTAERYVQSPDKIVKRTVMRTLGDLNRQRADAIKKAPSEKNKMAGDLAQKFGVEALNWYIKAANLNDDSSMVRLGQIYYTGQIIKKDSEKAQEYWLKATELGNATAMYNLAYFYEKDTTIFKNRKWDKAIEFYKKAINTPNTNKEIKSDAAFRLGNLYQYTKSKDFEKNSREAIVWYKVAAELNDSDAMVEIGYIYENGEQNTKPENTIKANKDEAIIWYKRAALLKNTDALSALKRLGV